MPTDREPARGAGDAEAVDIGSRQQRDSIWLASAEVALIFCLFFVLAAETPPDVNEAHYLAKAKHYWEKTWCAHDQFLNSGDAHLVFYWTCGWWTRWLSLPATAWLGRLLTWLLLAIAWRRLSAAVAPGPLYSLLTAALFAAFTRLGHLAGEWVIGGFEAKGFAYVLVLLALERLLARRWRSVWLLLGAASAFHVLVGGWSAIAAGGVALVARRDRPPLANMLPALALGGLFALPGVLPGLALTWGTDADTVAEATRIYVRERLPHHLLLHRILEQQITFDFRYLGGPSWTLPLSHLYLVRHLAVIAAWWWFARSAIRGPAAGQSNTRLLHLFVAAGVLIGGVGCLLDQATLFTTGAADGWLRYYWFRLSDVMPPLGLALAIGATVRRTNREPPPRGAWWLLAAITFSTLATADVYFRRQMDSTPPAARQSGSGVELALPADDWRKACDWIRDHVPPDAVVLTPRYQQTFKWDAQRAEVAAWKDIPQDAAGIVEWRRRIEACYPPEVNRWGLAAHGHHKLGQLADRYGFTYILFDRRPARQRLPFRRVYPAVGETNDSFEVYQVDSRP